MTKTVIATLFLAFAILGLHHANETVDQFHKMNWTSQFARTVYCAADTPKTVQDHVDCYIIQHL